MPQASLLWQLQWLWQLQPLAARRGTQRSRTRCLTMHAEKVVMEDTAKNHSGPACGDKLRVTVLRVRGHGIYCETEEGTEVLLQRGNVRMPMGNYQAGMELNVTVLRPGLARSKPESHTLVTDRDMAPLSSLRLGGIVKGRVIRVSDSSIWFDIGVAKIGMCWAQYLSPRYGATSDLEVGQVVPELKILRLHPTHCEVGVKECQIQLFKDLKIGDRLKGIVNRTSSKAGAVFFEVGAENNVAGFASRGQLAKRVQDYHVGEPVLVEVVAVAKTRVWVKHLGSAA